MDEHSAKQDAVNEEHHSVPEGEHRTVVEERVRVEPVAVTTERKMSVRSFIAGFLTAVVAAAIAIVVFLAVSDSDDDGQIELEVPTVDVDVDG